MPVIDLSPRYDRGPLDLISIRQNDLPFDDLHQIDPHILNFFCNAACKPESLIVY